MRVLITSGGTTENIDSVRGITNFATGRLGKLIAERFLIQNHEVILLAGLQALVPDNHDNLTIIRISGVANLLETMQNYLPTVDVVVHSMAVSDYTPIYMTDFETVAKSDDITEFLSASNEEKKISSHSDYQVLFLKKTPKVIKSIKTINQNVILFGFKLLVDVPKEHLIQVASTSLTQNKADFILANDLTTITAERHLGLLVSQNAIIEAKTKLDIADLIVAKSKETYDQNHTRRNW
ncbi:phosphopantothenate--cysteine ligase [Lactococcus hodotermopsidis]|uniref:Phosphopantothenate--cysteine ligase n=1 Tax=Pseudolactococcus hodotermopsidis TaxID=2709157 RepID=A0A6A0BA03_9LACT|nr:phosphopantothenate--cysteine ligase [Lactococcus hodotermopsidis]GFH41626.1 phosphopantothenate--cysteine ligase [Lactococcus hodotermopsidis]